MPEFDKKCEYPQCKNAGAPCRPECIGDLATYICPYDGFTETQGRAAEVLRHFAPSAERRPVVWKDVKLPMEYEAPTHYMAGGVRDSSGELVATFHDQNVGHAIVDALNGLASPSSASTRAGARWLLWFEDRGLSHEHYTDSAVAQRRYEECLPNWTCRLFVEWSPSSEQPTSAAAGSTKAAQGEDSHREGLATVSHASTPERQVIRPPFQKALTVVMTKDDGDKQADADLAAIRGDSGTVFRVGVSSLYFAHLRLRAALDPSLLDKIAVFYLRPEDQVLQECGLRRADELRWPVDFQLDLWEKETEIGCVRHPEKLIPDTEPAKTVDRLRAKYTPIAASAKLTNEGDSNG